MRTLSPTVLVLLRIAQRSVLISRRSRLTPWHSKTMSAPIFDFVEIRKRVRTLPLTDTPHTPVSAGQPNTAAPTKVVVSCDLCGRAGEDLRRCQEDCRRGW